MKGCIQSPPPNGHEDRDLSGRYGFRVRQPKFRPIEITWGSGKNFGEVSDAGHDSNILAIAAVQDAINGAFR
ncbi:hypothetical protein D3C85_1471100 [compost metagenome]